MGCNNSIVIAAPADKVWARLRNFHDMSWARGVIEKLETVGEVKTTAPGAKRILNGTFHETLHGINDHERSFTYSIDDGPGTPVAKDKVQGYVGHVQVLPVTADNSSFVRWTTAWESGSPEIAAFCNPIYKAFLDTLRTSFK